MSFYLDASVLVAMLVQEPSSSAVSRFLSQVDEPLLVSDFAAAEVASSVSRLVRMSQLTAEAGHRALARLDTWRASATSHIEVVNSDIVEAGGLVRRFELKLKAPEALHLAISLRAAAKLVTRDRVLTDAATACGATPIQP